MPRNPSTSRPSAKPTPHPHTSRSAPPTVSGRWLLKAVGIALAGAAGCTWLTLCLLFWQGSWQLLYHPAAAVMHTPAKDIGLPFDSIAFAATPAGSPRLHGWWIPAAPDSRFTVIYLHGADGNIGDNVESFIPLHAAKLNIFAFDYRGYGQSIFERPTEAHWREDTNSAIDYLVNTRHIAPNSLVLYGQGLGANLALEIAASHPELAGVVLDAPLNAPMNAVFNDPRAKLVPAHLLVRDRWDSNQAAAQVLIPSLWLVRTAANTKPQPPLEQAYNLLTARKEQVYLQNSPDSIRQYLPALQSWLDDLPNKQLLR